MSSLSRPRTARATPCSANGLKPTAAYILPVDPRPLSEWYTVVNTWTGLDAHAAAWTGDVPLFPDGSHTNFLASGLEKVAKSYTRSNPPR